MPSPAKISRKPSFSSRYCSASISRTSASVRADSAAALASAASLLRVFEVSAYTCSLTAFHEASSSFQSRMDSVAHIDACWSHLASATARRLLLSASRIRTRSSRSATVARYLTMAYRDDAIASLAEFNRATRSSSYTLLPKSQGWKLGSHNTWISGRPMPLGTFEWAMASSCPAAVQRGRDLCRCERSGARAP
ncbi:hypothetical protein B0T11DRAFT_27557 [Plectosphaerella cucumerina]|uniref:Uncharacterized protein n=1 Tax=Plectosphaerella cucumerina TaxID=40658 RepID=A0A8K0TWJ4_9PEZI|nr:hypothetical protein B0T11DRAFT_27557 [Plectosphaerella cucumerina]